MKARSLAPKVRTPYPQKLKSLFQEGNSMVKSNYGNHVHLVHALLMGIPLLLPSLRVHKTRLLFNVICDDKRYLCSIWGKSAISLCKYLHVGSSIEAYGRVHVPCDLLINKLGAKEMVHVDKIKVSVSSRNRAVFQVVKPAIWSVLSKTSIFSHLIPKQMRMEGGI